MLHLRIIAIALLVAGVSLVAVTGWPASAAAPRLVEISADQYDNPDSQHQTEVEPDTFAYGDSMLAAFQTGRAFDGGASNIGWAFSRDAGASWSHGFLPSLTINSVPSGRAVRASDPSVAYDRVHNQWLIASLTLFGVGNGVAVSRSSDGVHWSDPAEVVGQSAADKNWIVCDNGVASPFAGTCYAAWDDEEELSLLISTSRDGGVTWSRPVAHGEGFAVQPVVRPDGTLVIVALDPRPGIFSISSTDGANTFSSRIPVTERVDYRYAGDLRIPPLPSVEVDREGGVYVVWADCRFRPGCATNDIVMSTSSDGRGWSPVTRVPIDALDSTVDHFTAGIAVDPNSSRGSARLAITYYYLRDVSCEPAQCELNVGAVTSHDQGRTWQVQPLNDAPMRVNWLPDTNQGLMFGDYISTSFTRSGGAVTVVPIASPPVGWSLRISMFAARLAP